MRSFRRTPLRLAAAVILGVLACTSVAYAASLGVGSSKLHAWSQPVTHGTCNQTSSTADDTDISQKNPTTVDGSPTIPTTLTVSGSTSKGFDSFIRFNLSGCALPTTAGADSSRLTVFVTTTGGDTISLYPVYSSWSSGTLTWTGASSLTIGTAATTSFTPSASGAYTVPVTADVDAAIKNGTLWGWELKDTSGTKSASIASSTNGTVADRPSLALNDEK